MKNFPQKKIGEVVAIERSFVSASSMSPSSTYVGLENIESFSGKLNYSTTQESNVKSAKNKFSEDHVLFGRLRPYLAKVARPERSGVCSTDILTLKPSAEITRDYLFHFLLHPNTVSTASSRTSGANLPRLSPKELEKITIPIPPKNTQKKISSLLDSINIQKETRCRSIELLDELTQSIFLDMFGDITRNKKWDLGKVSDLVSRFESGKSLAAASDESKSKYRILKISAVTSGIFKPQESKGAPLAHAPLDTHFTREGDLLFSRANTSELIGATALVNSPQDNLLLPDKLWRFVWHDEPKADPLYVHHMFSQPAFRDAIRANSTGSSGSMKNISQKKVLSIPCTLPPLSLQREFADKARKIQELRAKKTAHLALLDELFASVQQRAFDGTLWDDEDVTA